jgi:hypothetical protein
MERRKQRKWKGSNWLSIFPARSRRGRCSRFFGCDHDLDHPRSMKNLGTGPKRRPDAVSRSAAAGGHARRVGDEARHGRWNWTEGGGWTKGRHGRRSVVVGRR